MFSLLIYQLERFKSLQRDLKGPRSTVGVARESLRDKKECWHRAAGRLRLLVTVHCLG